MTRERLLQALEAERLTPARTRMISVRFSDDELARLQAAAGAQRVPAASLARVLIMTGLDELGTGKGTKARR